MPAPYKAIDVANWILAGIDREAGDAITHLKLQKLVYYAQAWSLALHGRSLFDEELQAWAHGPVAESVFQVFKDYSWQAIPAPAQAPELAVDDAKHIDEIVSIYGDYSAKQLERMTHSEQPWLSARAGLSPEARSNRPINKDEMEAFYRRKYELASNGA